MGPFGYVPVSSALHDADSRARIVDAYAPALGALGGVRLTAEEAGCPGPLVAFVLTGGTEREVLDLWSRRRRTQDREPLLLLAHAGHNSLPAALEVLARVQQRGSPGRIFYLAGPDDAAGLAQLKDGLHDLRVRSQLRQARIGLVGAPSDWLVASSPDPDALQDAWGPQVIPVPIAAIHEQFDLANAAQVGGIADELLSRSCATVEPDAAALDAAARVYVALKNIVQLEALDAVSVRCFDLVTQLRTTGCFALAQLNDEGVIAGCEGDLATTVSMLWSHLLLGAVPWMANPSRLDEGANSMWLAHCTVPRGLVGKYRLRSHFESGLGVAIEGEFAAGPATVLRVGGARLERLWCADGEIVRAGDAADLCRTQIEVRLQGTPVSALLRAPLGNHLVVVRGHHADRLRSWWESMRG